MMETSRQVEERRFGAIQALRAVVECLRESNPQTIFSGPEKGKDMLDSTKVQAIANRWADKASDVLCTALELANRIAVDTLGLFAEEPASARKTAQ